MFKNKNIFLVITVATLIILLAACSGEASSNSENKDTSGDSIELRYAEVNPEGHPMTQAAEKFAELVNEKSDGRITINVYPAGQLGNETENIEGLQMGSIDFMRANPSVMANFGVEKMNVTSLPFIFRDREHLWNVLDSDIGEELVEDVSQSDTGLKVVMFVEEGARNFFFTDKVVKTPEDMKGIKVRVQENELMVDLVEALGASPTPVSYSELYSALQTGIVNGAENPPAAYLSNAFYEVADKLTLNKHIFAPNFILTSDQTWDKLSEEDQALLLEAGQETEVFVKEISQQADDDALAELEANGVEITEVDDMQVWQDAVQPLYEKYGAGYEELIDRIIETE
ncbi:TRAP transporter substrate-binding protein [Oceanobacillus saliphilus]|uniref:TRAP transporter substrate-binding protein n=1 Tax=Oceanobacillus saliphilus TaxID=2925834 RepID=UPI00201DF711|nr:TRAP transporter substrate-binding protein [Oceanobacillus saliphilus]